MENELNIEKYQNKPIIAYFIILILLCFSFIAGAKALGEKGMYLAQGYMLTPALAAIITRIFFYRNKFTDAKLKFGNIRDYLKFWIFSLLIVLLSYVIFYTLGAIKLDLSGQTFLNNLTEQFKNSGQNINDTLPKGMTPKNMMWLLMIGQLTVLNIFPGIITGFGEEFGHRGFMYTQMKKYGLWISLFAGGLIWFAWHLPLLFVIPKTDEFTVTQTILNYFVLAIGGISTFIYLVYVFEKSQSIWVVSIAHIVLNNASGAFSYLVIIQDRFLANIGLTITMVLVAFFGAGNYFLNQIKQSPVSK